VGLTPTHRPGPHSLTVVLVTVAAQAAVRIGWMSVHPSTLLPACRIYRRNSSRHAEGTVKAMRVRQGSGDKCQEADLWKQRLSFPVVPKQLPTLTN
jgi:hypothetical protein